MFEIGWSELLLIAVVAIIVIGPKELPGVLQGLGKTLRKFRRSADDFRRQFDESVRDTGFEDMQRDLRSMKDLHPVNQFRNTMSETFRTDPPLSPSAYDAAVEAKSPAEMTPPPQTAAAESPAVAVAPAHDPAVSAPVNDNVTPRPNANPASV